MNKAAIVDARSISLAYRLPHNRVGTLKEFTIAMLKRQITYERLWALSDVSFQIGRGEVFGIIGRNGAGKSTLMKIIARVLPPTEGRVLVRGSVAPMIELGAGFDHELTGFENIVLYGTLLGRDPRDMRARAGSIAEWAELTEFLDVPVRAYSTGMLARLGFGVATDGSPNLLVVDEVLSVGDERFARKSNARIQSLMEHGTAVALVSHALDRIVHLADRAMWLEDGRVKMLGDAREVVEGYQAST